MQRTAPEVTRDSYAFPRSEERSGRGVWTNKGGGKYHLLTPVHGILALLGSTCENTTTSERMVDGIHTDATPNQQHVLSLPPPPHTLGDSLTGEMIDTLAAVVRATLVKHEHLAENTYLACDGALTLSWYRNDYLDTRTDGFDTAHCEDADVSASRCIVFAGMYSQSWLRHMGFEDVRLAFARIHSRVPH